MKLIYKEQKHFIVELDNTIYEIFVDANGRILWIYNNVGEKICLES